MSRLRREGLLIGCAVAALLPILRVSGQQAAPTFGTRVADLDGGSEAIDQGVDPRWREPGEAKTLRDQVRDFTIVTPRPGRSLPYEPGRVIVRFREDASSSGRVAALAAVSAKSTNRPEHADFEIVNIADDADPVSAARELSARPDVEYAQADYRVKALYTPNDPLFSQQWNMTALDMPRAWDINPGATSDIVVAVIDTGVAWRNQSVSFTTVPVRLNGQITRLQVNVPFAAAPELTSATRWVAPRDFNWGDNNPADQDGHGTHVTGSVGQLTNNGVGVAGMAFNVRIMPVKVLTGDIEGELFDPPFPPTLSLTAQAIRYAADNGANVINMSLGSAGAPPSAVVESALRYAVGRGVFIVIAAGNEFEEGNPISVPARYGPEIDGVITVGSVGRALRRAYYSSTGSYVEIAAPGGDLRANGAAGGILQQTYLPDAVEVFPPRFDLFVYAPFQGTSMAAPHVAGFAALLMQQGVRNPAAIEAAMKRFARDLGPAGRDNEFGYGLIDPPATLRGLGYVR